MRCHNNHQSGFSLIECVVAIALLATVLGSMISMQGTVVRILQFSTEKEKAAIELNSVMAQFEYVINTTGFKALPKTDQSTKWTSKSNPTMTDTVSIIKSDVKLSQFLLSAFNIYYIGRESEKPNTDLLKPIADMLDTQIALQLIDPAINAEVSVSWMFGKEKKSIVEKLFLLNNDAIDNLKFNPPQPPKS